MIKLVAFFFVLGCCYEEYAREEHTVGEHVLEDLESRSSKEAGSVFF